MESLVKKPTIIYAESTPNPSTMKFVANRLLIHDGATAEYRNPSETAGAPLPAQLFQFPFVKAVFISSNFVTITKIDAVAWEDVLLQMREFLKNYLSDDKPVIVDLPKTEVHTDNRFKDTTTVFTEHTAPANETEHRIIEILEQYIRPAVEQDGGLITFKSFVDGVVTVQMKGACSGCPSSTLTLKAGIEGLLKRMVPDVKEVVSEAV